LTANNSPHGYIPKKFSHREMCEWYKDVHCGAVSAHEELEAQGDRVCSSVKTDTGSYTTESAVDRSHSLEADRGIGMAPNAMLREQRKRTRRTIMVNKRYNIAQKYNLVYTLE